MTDPYPSRLKPAKDLAAILMAALVLAWHLWTKPSVFAWDALFVTIIFAVAGWALRGVSVTGAIGGGIIAFVLYFAGGWKMFAVLFLVFFLTWLATRVAWQSKLSLGLAESKTGRDASQVVSNLIVAGTVLVFVPEISGMEPAMVMAVAALAEAAADTVSSEIGEAFGKQTYLITTFKPVAAGTDGGISWIGTCAGAASAAIVCGGAFFLVLNGKAFLPCFLGGMAGMLMDSLLGATLERNGFLNNDAVNFLGTVSSVAIALLLYEICS